LAPGSEFSSQIIGKKPFPDSIRFDLSGYIGCISGALELEEYRVLMKDAGFTGE
jgi:hypothetical protein